MIDFDVFQQPQPPFCFLTVGGAAWLAAVICTPYGFGGSGFAFFELMCFQVVVIIELNISWMFCPLAAEVS